MNSNSRRQSNNGGHAMNASSSTTNAGSSNNSLRNVGSSNGVQNNLRASIASRPILQLSEIMVGMALSPTSPKTPGLATPSTTTAYSVSPSSYSARATASRIISTVNEVYRSVFHENAVDESMSLDGSLQDSANYLDGFATEPEADEGDENEADEIQSPELNLFNDLRDPEVRSFVAESRRRRVQYLSSLRSSFYDEFENEVEDADLVERSGSVYSPSQYELFRSIDSLYGIDNGSDSFARYQEIMQRADELRRELSDQTSLLESSLSGLDNVSDVLTRFSTVVSSSATTGSVEEQRSAQSSPKLDSYESNFRELSADISALEYAENLMFGINGEKKNEKLSFRIIEEIARKTGNARAFGLLGFCYEFGIGCAQDFRKCEHPYTVAAHQDDALAMSRLSFLRRYGRPHVRMNRGEAEMWLQKLEEIAERVMQSEADGTLITERSPADQSANSRQERKFARGPLKWLWWAANDCSNASAQYALGTCFHDGVGTNKNPELAVEWYRRSAHQGCARGEGILGYCYGEGFGVKKDSKEALRWYLSAAAKGETVAMYNVGFCYEEGIGLPQDYAQAHDWYLRAALENNGLAANSLGYFYEEGLGVDRDMNLAVQWYHTAAELGNPWAEHNLGHLYTVGVGVTEDKRVALHWFKRAAAQGHAGAQNRLGQAYQMGYGVAIDTAQAVQWYRLAADQKHGPACINLAWCLENGVGTRVDLESALKMLDRALEVKCELAQGPPLIDWATSIGMRVSMLKIAQIAGRKVESGTAGLAHAS